MNKTFKILTALLLCLTTSNVFASGRTSRSNSVSSSTANKNLISQIQQQINNSKLFKSTDILQEKDQISIPLNDYEKQDPKQVDELVQKIEPILKIIMQHYGTNAYTSLETSMLKQFLKKYLKYKTRSKFLITVVENPDMKSTSLEKTSLLTSKYTRKDTIGGKNAKIEIYARSGKYKLAISWKLLSRYDKPLMEVIITLNNFDKVQ